MIEEKLARFIDNEKSPAFRNYTLGPVTALLGAFGDPHRRFLSVHIAGTNGKGSTAHMLSGILRESGYRCGLYTSPHLLDPAERVSINGEQIDAGTLDRYADDALAFLDGERGLEPTYFDIFTFMAFMYFSEKKVDVAVVETGLGGRLDSTNVINPLCSVITDIGLDHTALLGDTPEKIASEKAGIIKPGAPMITSNKDSSVLAALSGALADAGSKGYFLARDFHYGNVRKNTDGFTFDYEPIQGREKFRIADVALPLYNRVQVKNAVLAITAASLLSDRLPEINAASIRNGIKNIRIPGRYEVLSRDPLIIFDPAHNLSALVPLIDTVNERHKGKKIVLVLSLMKDKDFVRIIPAVRDRVKRVVYYNLDIPRGLRIPEHFDPGDDLVRADTLRSLHEIAGKNGDYEVILFTGTFRLYSAAIGYARFSKTANKGA